MKTHRKKIPLGTDMIVEAALELIDKSGLEKFSVREVARTLKVFPTAIYWHVSGGRNGLLAEVVARALRDVAPSFGPRDDWEQWIRSVFERYRESLQRHPNVAPLIGAQLVSNAGVNPVLVERVLAALESAGFRGKRLVDTYNTVIAALLGYVTLEMAPAPADDAGGWAQSFEEKIRSLPAAEYPRLVANLDRLANRAFIVRWQSGNQVPLDDGFRMYVDTVVAGLRSLVATRSGRRRT
jgi:TetR/AcrR family transcriptional regulator, tetracycline repressor protein